MEEVLKFAARFVGAMQIFNETTPNAKVAAIDNDVDEDLVRKFAVHAGAELQPMAAFLGGVVAQEVVKVGRAWNSHIVNFDEFSMNLSPNLIRDSQIHYSIIQNFNEC